MSRFLQLRVKWSGDVNGLEYLYVLRSWEDFALLWQKRMVQDNYLMTLNPSFKTSGHPRIAVMSDSGKESPPPSFELDEM